MTKESSSVQASSGGGISGSVALTIVFVILKALGYLTWSWVWVLAPLWIGAAVSLLVLGALIVILALAE